MKRAMIIAVVVLVAAAGIGGYFIGSYGSNSPSSSSTQLRGVQLTQSNVNCYNGGTASNPNYYISASFGLSNTSGQTESVQVELVAGNQILTQNTYTLGAAGSQGDSLYSLQIRWQVTACPTGVHLALA